MYDLLIVGAGTAGVSCAMVLGSAKNLPFVSNKKIGLIAHTQMSDLNAAVLNNLYGVAPNTKGKELVENMLTQLKEFSNIEQLAPEMITSVLDKKDYYEIKTAENTYQAKTVVLAIGNHPRIEKIEGLSEYITEHTKSLPGVSRVALKNTNLVVKDGLFVAGLLSGCASQAAIASGTGADVAVQILTLWNGGEFVHYHDK